MDAFKIRVINHKLSLKEYIITWNTVRESKTEREREREIVDKLETHSY